MSAILGRIDFSGRPIDKALFVKAMSAIAHYGRDGSGATVAGAVALGFHDLRVARRKTHEQQPARLDEFTIVADVILDNRRELAGKLGLGQPQLDALPDSALVLRAYRKWREACLQHLIGDYAFAIYDEATRSLFLARDHIGARPLYYFHRDNVVLFATDMRGLVAFTDIEWRIDESSVAQYLMRPNMPLAQSFFTGARPVQPGHWVRIAKNGKKERRWWDPASVKPIHYPRTEDYVARLRELLEIAVADRVDTDAAVGSHISGGIDSTAITSLAARRLQKEGRNLAAAFSWAPPVSENYPDMGVRDERRIIDAICRREGVHCEYGTADGQLSRDYMARQMELDGIADLLEEIAVVEKASNCGVRVLLSGWGGDEAVSAQGNGYLPSLLKRGRLIRAARIARSLSGGRRRPKILARTLWKWGIVPMLPNSLYHNYTPFQDIFDKGCFPSKALLARASLPASSKENILRLVSDPLDFIRSSLTSGHIGMRMDTWAAWSAPQGIVYRYPFTDRRTLEFVLGVPHDHNFHDGEGRYLARASLNDCLIVQPSKFDMANEKLRHNNRRVCWALLADEIRTGHMNTSCEWIDASMLRRAIIDLPEKLGRKEVACFARITAALRVLFMYLRL